MMFSAAVELFMQACQADGLAPETLAWYARRLGPMLLALGPREVADIKAFQVREVLIAIRNDPVRYVDHPFRRPAKRQRSMVTTASYTRTAKRVFNWLVIEGYLEASPVCTIKMPPPGKRLPHAIDVDDLKQIRLVAAANPRDALLLCLFCSSGARVGGIVGLRPRDINLDAGEMIVHEKGDRERVAYLDEETKRALTRYAIAFPRKPEDYLFPRRAGGHLRGDSVWHIFKRLAKKAGVRARFNPHAIRHAFAREYLMNGGDLKSLSLIMGHATVVVTAEYYANYEDNHLKEKFRMHAALGAHSSPAPSEMEVIP